MSRSQSRGICSFCNREMSKGGLTRHLKSCPEREKASAAANEKRQEETIYHLQVQDRWDSDYWLHLEMRGRAMMSDLDRYLRNIWLECCGHLSMFSPGGWGTPEISMSRRADGVFKSHAELVHIYDFGTSSTTLVRVADARQGAPLTNKPIYLMARNIPPELTCQECDRPATFLCVECIYEEDLSGALCAEHVAGHPHVDYGPPYPVVNSPRVGLCGYEGPAEPPY